MKPPPTMISILCTLLLSSCGSLDLFRPAAVAGAPAEAAMAIESPWIAKKEDNVCGLQDLHMLSNPAKLNYQDCLESTKEWKQMVNDGIDPNSAEGVNLRRKAKKSLVKTCEKVMKDEKHCSIWKKIKRRDAGAVPDVSKKVKEELPK